MSTGKGFLAGIIATGAAYVAYKALPEEQQNQLKEKAKEVTDQVSDRAMDLAYSASDAAGEIKDRADKAINSDGFDGAKKKVRELLDDVTPSERVRKSDEIIDDQDEDLIINLEDIDENS